MIDSPFSPTQINTRGEIKFTWKDPAGFSGQGSSSFRTCPLLTQSLSALEKEFWVSTLPKLPASCPLLMFHIRAYHSRTITEAALQLWARRVTEDPTMQHGACLTSCLRRADRSSSEAEWRGHGFRGQEPLIPLSAPPSVSWVGLSKSSPVPGT